jgi:hypothetical protein
MSSKTRPVTTPFMAAALLAAATLGAAQTAQAATQTTDYSITLAGFSLASATFKTEVEGQKFSIEGKFTTTGLARLVKKIQGTASVSGNLKGNAFVANAYETRYVAGTAQKRYGITFSNGRVKSYVAEPNRVGQKDWIAVTPEDLVHAVDPLSGLLIPANRATCQGTVAIFDGEMRTDLVLSEKGTRPILVGEKLMDARVCGLKVKPMAGFRKGKNDMDYVAGLKNMEIWFAKSPTADVYAPVKIKASTGFGSFNVTATRFGA